MATRYPSQLELTLISASDLKNVNWRYGELRPYAVAWVDHDSKFTSRVDEDGGTDPSWKEKLSIPVLTRLDTAELSIDIVHVEAAGETKPLVGSVRLFLGEVFDQVGYDRNCIKTLKLKRPSGRPQGMIEFRLEFVRNRYVASDPYMQPNYGNRDYGAPAPSGAYGYAAAALPAGYASNYNGSGYGLAPPAQSYYGGGGYNGAPAAPVVEYNTAPPLQPYYGSGGNTGYAYGGAPQGVPATGAYDAAPAGQPHNKMGGMGAGLAVGAVAGVLGGLALAGGANYVGDKIAEKAAEKVGDGYGYGGYDDDSSDDD